MSFSKRSFIGFLMFFLFVEIFLPDPGFSKSPKKEKKKAISDSHRFFNFEETPYFTSPDKRIGVKFLIDSAKVGPSFVSLQHITLLPKSHVKSHRHVYVTEVVYILKGNLTLRIEKEIKVMGANTTAFIPPQTFHEYLNDSGDVCEFLQIYSPSGPEEEYRNWEKPGVGNAAQTAGVAKSPVGGLPLVPSAQHPAPSSNVPSYVTTVASGELKLKLNEKAKGKKFVPSSGSNPAPEPSKGGAKGGFEVEFK
ncbi:cupin domain-containing protein [bacterium]|nr:cupin domain-containing protein [bacterium]